MVADKLHIPGVAKTRPSLSIPGKLIFPRLVNSFVFVIYVYHAWKMGITKLCMVQNFDGTKYFDEWMNH